MTIDELVCFPSMIARADLVASFVLTWALTCCEPASAAPFHHRPAFPPLRQEPMTFYVVKGSADACGRGCDTWIEAEGKIESDSAARFKAFLNRQRDRNLPIYFSSPGGNLDQALAMGNMLHAKPLTARVGRTLVRECGFEAQDSDVCIKLKQSDRELHGDLFTSGAICASACPYLFAGAPVHEVAPDAVLAVHSVKVLLSFRGGQPDPSAIAAADHRGHERADRLVSAYLAKVGIDAGLLGLARSVKFEDIHVLTREEIARFGLDRRDIVETPWQFESNGLNMMRKIAFARGSGETSFRLLQWRVTCFDSDSFSFDFLRPARAGALVAISHHGASPVYFSGPLISGTNFEQWGMRLIRSRLESLVNQPQIEMIESSLASDGRTVSQTTKLSNEGWRGAMEPLVAHCPLSKGALTILRSSQSGNSNPAAK